MSVTKWKEREKEMRRNDIIEAAEKLFFSRGYDNVSMNDIAKEVGLSKATLYLYFENKEELFFSIVLRGVQKLYNIVKNEVEKEEKGIKKIEAFKKAYMGFINDYSDYFQAYNYLQSGRFNLTDILDDDYIKEMIEKGRLSSNLPSSLPSSTTPVISYLKDIFKLKKEIFCMLHDAIEISINDGSISLNTDKLELAVVLILIYENMGKLRPDIKMLLESENINQEKFIKSVETISHMMIVREE